MEIGSVDVLVLAFPEARTPRESVVRAMTAAAQS